MKLRLFSIAAALIAAPPLVLARDPLKNLEVLVVGDTLSAASEVFRPTKDKPVYYVISGKTELDIGEVVAGIKPTDQALVEREVVGSLASQGFVRTGVGGPMPSIAMLLIWGNSDFAYSYANQSASGAEKPTASMQGSMTNYLKTIGRNRPIDPTAESLKQDYWKIEALLGTNRWMAPPPKRILDQAEMTWDQTVSPEQLKILELAAASRVYVSIVALDATALRQKQKRILWRTNITIDGRQKLADALPVMLASAAPYYGRRVDKPVFLDDKARRAAQVEIGDLAVVPEKASSSGASPKKR